MGKDFSVCTRFQTQTVQKPYPMGRHILYGLYKGVSEPPSPPRFLFMYLQYHYLIIIKCYYNNNYYYYYIIIFLRTTVEPPVIDHPNEMI